ncbi:MOSC domain-containing protein [Polymorphobacter fuscus]|uniref:MOSC domain-containing protein n=1 Tax=Sandarakinorhabdus fusca TaxID=1439888 RepID=A0A7C9KXB3_9SPHN|nr:MOSC domain-containing protein [Polymorphobacter fuscus]KAB7646160.1 MOSC domain-containing protein [Polymorphobacter fuscus]MQT17362.1 MOSC domain-containing protein [Polymorphobacter fuscus]NJC10104.1 MOSC domain-containing protein YiiM [Polymorphobacter fuscus]
MHTPGQLLAVHIGKVARLANAGRGGAGLMTAYRKTAVAGPVAVLPLGLAGDEQGNRRVHGGPEKAVYGYPASGYAGWRAELPDIADRFGPGAMGENLVVAGQDESSLCIGDMVRCGTALLQIAQIREPCSTFAAVLGTTRVVRAMVRSGRCGWYYRVVEPGIIAPGDRHEVVDRPNPDWTVARFAAFAAGRGGTVAAIAELTTLPGLTPAWQRRAAAALASQTDR